jgi:hypothetical protein
MGKASPPNLIPPGLASASPPIMRKAPSLPGGGVPKAPPMPLLSDSLDEPTELPLGRRLHWKPLRNVDDTIWADMGDGDSADFTSLKSVFDDDKKETKPSFSSSSSSLGKGANDEPNVCSTLLEAKRAQNIGVVVARIPVELVTDRLKKLEIDSLSVEVLDRLKTILPSDEEISCFVQFKGDVKNLRDIERKVFDLFQIPRLSQRIKFCSVSLILPNQIAEVK